MLALDSSPSSRLNMRNWNLNTGSLDRDKSISTEPLIQPSHPNDLPQVIPIDRTSLQADLSGITRRITTSATHLANLHVVKHPTETGKSQVGIQSANLEFLATIGGPGEDAGKGIVVDEKGNSYITGYYDTRDPDQGTDVFVAKLDPTGKNLVWFITFGGPGRDEGHGIARDQKGNLYVTGTIDTGDPERGVDAFVAKLDSDGNFLYEPLLIGGPYNDEGNGITVNAAGEAYMTGLLGEQGRGTGTPLVAKIQADGSDVVYAFAENVNYDGNGIGLDSDGNIYLVGNWNSWGPIRIWKYNAEKTGELPQLAWSYLYQGGGGSEYHGSAIAVEPNGTYYWSGWDDDHSGDVEALVGKGGPGGVSDIVYIGMMRFPLRMQGFGVAYDPAGHLYVSGTTDRFTAFVVETNGSLPRLQDFSLWNQTVAGYSMVLDNAKPNPNAYITGTLNTGDPKRGIDAFVAKVNFQ
jgi:hypothetical protein